MKTSNEFKQALRAGKLSEAFLLAMSNAPELHITTWVTSGNDEASAQKEDSNKPPAGNFLRTHINLVEGKIDNEIGEKLLEDPNSAIQKFHWQQVNQGHQAIQQNLQSLQKMFHLMTVFEQQRQTGNTTGMNWVDVETDNALNTSSGTNELQGDRRSLGSLGAAQPETVATEQPSVGEITGSPIADETSAIRTTKVEPQLPAFAQEEDDDAIVNDLLSLADIDGEADSEPEDDEDWGQWLEEEETPVKPEIVDLNSLNHAPD